MKNLKSIVALLLAAIMIATCGLATMASAKTKNSQKTALLNSKDAVVRENAINVTINFTV